MARVLDDLAPRTALVEIARDFHSRGWMAGSAGNVSVRDGNDHFWISASGRPKGRLEENDFLLVRVADGAVIDRIVPANKPSAETAIHRTIYALFPEARACLHGHSVDGMWVADSAKPKATSLRLPPIEMIKGFDIWNPHPKVDLPLFENHLDVAHIARDMEARFAASPPPLTALVVRSHGATVWGTSLQQAYNRFEILEFILSYMAKAQTP